MPSLQLLDYSTANSIEHFVQYYVMFSTFSVLLNIIRFVFYNFFTQDNKDTEVKQLRAEVENLQNVLEEVVKYLNRNRENYDEEKTEFVDPAEKTDKPTETNEAKED